MNYEILLSNKLCPPNYGEKAIFKNLESKYFKVFFISLTRQWATNVLMGKDFMCEMSMWHLVRFSLKANY